MRRGNLSGSEILTLVKMLSKSIESEERLCEQRITFFLTIGTVAIGAVKLLEKTEKLSPDQFFWGMLGVLGSLLVFGLHTMNRMNWRALEISIWRNQLGNALRCLSGKDSIMKVHLDIRKRFDVRVQTSAILGKVKGGPGEFMYITNGLILAGIALIVGERLGCEPNQILVLCVDTFLVAALSLWLFCTCLRERFTPKLDDLSSRA
jgi:hypothetical protein